MISATKTAEQLSVADLRKAGRITSHDVVAAINAFMRDPKIGPYHFASGHSLDVAALVNASPVLKKANRSRPIDAGIRTAPAAAIMAAHPTPP